MTTQVKRGITDEDLVDERVAARILCISPYTLGDARRQGRGPAYYKIGGKMIRYAISDLNAYCKRHSGEDNEESAPIEQTDQTSSES